jgi:hypothetical protein
MSSSTTKSRKIGRHPLAREGGREEVIAVAKKKQPKQKTKTNKSKSKK